ncbi:IS630 transposase-related protein [Neochlamydia sp. EPS4]|uniref:IS630 transposase-related protein n=1 Tax=Neochlamydia sp. EPS4 TaxID=1478175 RepID=UPI000694054C
MDTADTASHVFGVTVRTLTNWIKQKERGYLAPKKRRQSPSKIDSEKLKLYINQAPDAYLREIAEAFGVTIASVFYACKRLKITLKKRHPSTRKEMRISEKNLDKS